MKSSKNSYKRGSSNHFLLHMYAHLFVHISPFLLKMLKIINFSVIKIMFHNSFKKKLLVQRLTFCTKPQNILKNHYNNVWKSEETKSDCEIRKSRINLRSENQKSQIWKNIDVKKNRSEEKNSIWKKKKRSAKKN